MNAHGLRFKRSLEDGVSRAHARLRDFRAEFHVDELLKEVIEGRDDAHAIAAKALHWLCVEDAKYNGCIIGLKSVLAFLHEKASHAPESDNDCQACLHDLKRVLAGPTCSVEQISDWIARWFRA